MNRALAYADRIRGDRADNLEIAIAGYNAALKILTREVTPVDWARVHMNRAGAYAQRIRGSVLTIWKLPSPASTPPWRSARARPDRSSGPQPR